jgi:hypothetical protein
LSRSHATVGTRIDQEGGELVAAGSSEQVASTHHLHCSFSDTYQKGVPGGVTERVIDAFQLVNIDGQDGEETASADVSHVQFEAAPVGQSGEGIGGCLSSALL